MVKRKATESEARALIKQYEGLIVSEQTNETYDKWRKNVLKEGNVFTPDSRIIIT